jgi:ESS family glutamate:Na+ symporter
VELDPLQTLLLALGCLLMGSLVNARIRILGQYNIPAPVTGGLLFAALASAAAATAAYRIDTNALLKPILLLMFFAAVGLGADLRQLARGGRALLRFVLVLIPFIALQNLLGIALASALDLHPLFGLVAGSITQVGGHGTGAAYAGRFAEVYNLQAVMELSMTAATFGLIIGGILAGPVAQLLIRRNGLRAAPVAVVAATGTGARASGPVDAQAIVLTLAGVLLALLAGRSIAGALYDFPLTIPSFLWCMVIGVAVRNVAPFAGLHFDDRAAELVAGVCLGLFLAMTMMSLDLGEVALSAGPLLVILVAQAALVAVFAYFVAFRALGRDYEAAVSCAAFIGFGMGSTATAIANMQAVTARHGIAPMAYLVVPLVGAFFVDLINALILTGFLALDWLGG